MAQILVNRPMVYQPHNNKVYGQLHSICTDKNVKINAGFWPPLFTMSLCASKTPEARPAGVLLLVSFTMLDRL